VSECENASGNTINDNGDLGNGCVRNWTQHQVTVLTIDAGCLAGGGGGGTGGTGGTGSTGNGSTAGNGPGGSTGGGSAGGGTNSSGNYTYIATSMVEKGHLEKLTFQTNNYQIKSRIQQMQTDVNTADKE